MRREDDDEGVSYAGIITSIAITSMFVALAFKLWLWVLQ